MIRKTFGSILIAVAVWQVSAVAGTATVKYPKNWREWTHVKTLILQAGHPLADPFEGLHHVYVNPAGKEAIEAGKTPLPEGTVLVFDLHEAAAADNAIAEGPRKFIGVMEKSTAKFGATGGWGFEAFKGDSQERAVTDGGASCWNCHASQPDGVFSKWTK
jgi:hypothetical protein